jgi:magnesium transporter
MYAANDILQEKLEQAFHRETSVVALHEVAKIASEHSPIDLAYAASRLPASARPVLYENLVDSEAKISFMANADSSTRVAVFRYISDSEVKTLLELMPSNEAVEILEDISERRFRRVMEILDPVKAQHIREIKKHERNTAGRLMTNEYFSFVQEMTLGEAIDLIRAQPGIELTSHVFVLDQEKKLLGIVPARNLIVNASQLTLRQVMKPIQHTVTADTSREEVLELVERYKIAALPVVDEEGCLAGVIAYNEAIDAMEDRMDATIANMAGTTERIQEHRSLFRRILSRGPWLIVTLFAGLINGSVMSSIQNYAQGILTFALFFVPLITGMSGNIGIQSSTLLVRSMGLGLLSPANRREIVFRELRIGLTTGILFGVVCAVLVSLLGFAYTGMQVSPMAVGIVVGTGLTGACLAGSLLGVVSPLFFARIGVDPAVASGPIITAFNDVLSMLIYFLIATGLSTFLF